MSRQIRKHFPGELSQRHGQGKRRVGECSQDASGMPTMRHQCAVFSETPTIGLGPILHPVSGLS
jgi:hypothetical protein